MHSATHHVEPEADARIASLPATLKTIAEHIGYRAAVRLVDVFPGARLHIPHKVSPDHELRLLGDDVVNDLARVFADHTIEVPTRLISTEARQRTIITLAKRTPYLSPNEIALEVGTTRRHVSRVLRKARDCGEVPRAGTYGLVEAQPSALTSPEIRVRKIIELVKACKRPCIKTIARDLEVTQARVKHVIRLAKAQGDLPNE